MTTATLRPNGTNVAPDSVTGAASAHAATNDDSDASYFTETVLCRIDFGTTTLPAGAVTKSLRARFRGRTVSGTDVGPTVSLDEGPFTTTIVSAGAASWSTTITTAVGAYSPVTLTQAQVDALSSVIDAREVSGGSRFMELYADLIYVTIPVVAVDAVSPDPYTATTTVPISWVNTLDSDGGAQTRYEIKVFTDAQYGAGGFDPDTSTAYYESGVVASSAGTADVGPLENGDTYRAYVRVAQTVNGALHWSDWDFDEFTMNVTTSDVDTVTAVATDASGLITVTAAWDSGSTGWEYIEVQRTIDGGATWVDVRGATYVETVDSGATDFTVVDYEVPNGTSASYRARATYLSSSLPITGSWVESSATSWSSGVPWLKAPNDPTLNLSPSGIGRVQAARGRRAGVFQVLGARLPVVVSDVRSGFGGTLPVLTETAGQHADLVALLNGSDIILVQYPAAWDIDDAYVHVLSDAEDFASVAPLQLARTWPLSVVEVDAPADPDAGR